MSEATLPRRPAEHRRPQITVISTLRRGYEGRGWILTFKLPRILRLLELSIIAAIPEAMADGSKAPVYIRFWVDTSQEDKPGAVIVE